MFKLFLPFIALLLISGCSNSSNVTKIKPSAKVFEEEDNYILSALHAEELKDYTTSSEIYNRLYKKAHKKEYLYRSLQNSLALKRNIKVIKQVDEIGIDKLDDFILVRMKIIALIQLQKLELAKELAIKLVNKSNEVDDYLLVSDIYVQQKKYDTAVKYLESAYTKDYNEKILDKMAIILYVNLKRRKDAIAYLETHSRINSCSRLICSRLIGFYSNDNNIDGLLSVYLRLYKIDSSKKISKKIVQIYKYKKEYLKLMGFLEKSNSDDELLLNLYQNSANYKKAAPLAYKIYAKTGKVYYLGQSAIFEYESYENKNDKLMLKKVVKIKNSPVYLNYLGYIMIDHNIKLNEAIKYIYRALKIEPNSAFYLDSLAWGYYKLGECKKANEIMNKVVRLDGGDNVEVQLHFKEIQKCTKNKKVKNKK